MALVQGVQGLHVRGLAHVDLKPGNLFVRDWEDLARLHCSVHDLGGSRGQFAGVALLSKECSAVGLSILQLQHYFASSRVVFKSGMHAII